MIQRRNTATKRQTLLHCGALAAILGVVVGLIFLVHPGCVYGAQTDWSNQHFAIPEYFRTGLCHRKSISQLCHAAGQRTEHFQFRLLRLIQPGDPAFVRLPLDDHGDLFADLQHSADADRYTSVLLLAAEMVCSKSGILPGAPLSDSGTGDFHGHHHIMFVNYLPFYSGRCSRYITLWKNGSLYI